MKYALITICFFMCMEISAQPPCACCTASHQQFDFWVGDWNVYDTLGNLIGQNTIEKQVSDCLLSEYWRGESGVVGRSFSYYNRTDSTWNQVWIDAAGNNLVLKGKLDGKNMVLESKLQPGQKIAWYRNRITWAPAQDGSITQLWEILNEEGKMITQIFKGIYKMK